MSDRNNKKKKTKETGMVQRQSDLPAFQNAFPFAGTTPFSMMRRFMDDMDRLFDDFGGFRMTPFFTPSEMGFPKWDELEPTAWSPKIEVMKNDRDLTVRADLPGLKPEDINLEITDGALVLSGERKEEKDEKKEGFYRTERTYGSFYRSIPVPDTVKPENATAKFTDGVLEIKIAIPEATGRKILIEEGKPETAKAIGATK